MYLFQITILKGCLFTTILWSIYRVSISDSKAGLFSIILWSVYLVFMHFWQQDLSFQHSVVVSWPGIYFRQHGWSFQHKVMVSLPLSISHSKADLFSTMLWSVDLVLASNRKVFLQGCHLLIIIDQHQTARLTLCTLSCSLFTCASATLYCRQFTCASATLYCHQFTCASATLYCHQFTCASAFPLSSPSPGSRCSSGSQTPWGQWLCNTKHPLSV